MATLLLRVRYRGRLATLRGIEVESVEPSTTVSAVPGCAFCMALVRGQIIPVLELGDATGSLVVGRVRGEVLGVTGLDIVGFDLTDANDESQPDTELQTATGEWRPALGMAASSPTNETLELDVEQWVAKIQVDPRIVL